MLVEVVGAPRLTCPVVSLDVGELGELRLRLLVAVLGVPRLLTGFPRLLTGLVDGVGCPVVSVAVGELRGTKSADPPSLPEVCFLAWEP